MPSWKKVITSGSDASLNSLYSPSITGSLHGTASYAISASYALTASYSKNLQISGSVNNVDYIDFTTTNIIGTNAPAWKEGRLFYDSGSGALAMYNWEQDVTLNIGQEQWLRARNQTGVTITNGSVVRLVGAIGDRPTVELAQSTDQTNTFSTGNEIIGMATHNIEHGTDGFITTFGTVNGLNTSTYAAGDLLWVSQSAGQFTKIAPGPPFDRTFVGIVVRSNPSNGAVFMTPLTPIHFHDISSVSASAYEMGDIWMYRSGSAGKANAWINTKSLTGSYSISGSLTAASFTGSLLGTAATASYVLQAVSASFATTASNISPAISNDVNDRVTTTNGNGTLNAEGNLTFNGQTLSVLYGVGDEGGEILLGKAATNTTLTGSGITVDVYQNKLRFFEQGGSARGFYLDISTGGGGASTNLASGGGTVTSVDTTGTVNGITLTGGPITGAGTITLGGTLSGIQSSQLATSSLMIGTTNIPLGATASSLTGLTSINSTSFTGSLFGTATTASYVLNSVSASFATLAQTANTASYVVTAQTASYVLQAMSASYAMTASYSNTSTSASYALSASYVPSTPAFPYTGSAQITGSLGITGSFAVQTYDGIFANAYVDAIRISDGGRNIYDIFGTGSIDAGGRILIDNMFLPSLGWLSRTMFDSTGGSSINWNSRIAYDGSGAFTSIDWANRLLVDSSVLSSVDWNSRELLDSAGDAAITWNYLSQAQAVEINSYTRKTLNLGTVVEGFSNLPVYASFNPDGEILKGVALDASVVNFDLVYLETDGKWYPVDVTTSSSSKLLGIAWNVGTGKETVLIEGNMVVNNSALTDSPLVLGVDHGLPIYIRNGSGAYMSTTAPGSSGNYVRVLGHAYYQGVGDSNYWVMKFRPANDWYVI